MRGIPGIFAVADCFSTHPVQVEQEAHHKITLQYHAPGILNIVVAGGAGNALVLVQDIIDRKFQFPIFLFKHLFAQAGIPQRYALVISIGPA